MRQYTNIILAVNTIGWLSHRQSEVTEQIRQIAGTDSVLKRIVEGDDEFMADITKRLTDIANELGDYMNNNDCIEDVDEKVVNGMLSTLNASFLPAPPGSEPDSSPVSSGTPCSFNVENPDRVEPL